MRAVLCVILILVAAGCTRPEDEAATQTSADAADVEASVDVDGSGNATSEASAQADDEQASNATAPGNQTAQANSTASWNETWSNWTGPMPPGMSGWTGEGDDANAANTTRFEESFTLTLTELPVVGAPGPAQGESCILFTSDNLTMIVSGSAVATWTSETPLSDVLRLSDDGDAVEGVSPLAFNLTGGIVPQAFPDVGFGFEAPAGPMMRLVVSLPSPPALALQQSVEVALSFDYWGAEPDVQASACG